MANLITGFLNIIKGNEIRNPADREEAQPAAKRRNTTGSLHAINEISKRLRNGLSIDTTLSEIVGSYSGGIPLSWAGHDAALNMTKRSIPQPAWLRHPVFLNAYFKTISCKDGVQCRYIIPVTASAADEEPFLEEEKQFVETLALLDIRLHQPDLRA
ncbi:MAG: hypothetical protein MZV63_10640 [Marinilabiliales bacterium]|nr:hypothetical protein [Marinilabiliales bacterium]